ncbi:MAG: site-2 protease family protein [Acidimicrobiales bacterium]
MSTGWSPPGAGPGRAPRRGPELRTLVLLAVAFVVGVFLVHDRTISHYEIIYFCVLIPSIILHEVSHGFAANLLGDDTAKRAGRLTLNPLAHIDPAGSIVVPAVLVLTSGVAFGWAKPVPVAVNRLRHPRNGSVAVALAGPATNAVLFLVAALAFRFGLSHSLFLAPTDNQFPLGYQILLELGLANITVGVFNLIPIPPLDGSAVVERMVPDRHLHRYYRLRPYGMVIVFLFALFFLRGTGLGTHLFDGELRLWDWVSGTNF